ncbi:MAG: MarR family transcriptional regulator [Bacilli bacterium]|jgi:DNA-binding MarR family transcriptional regulator|nr:MarR family transcriptional regulator [Bacilli bacterium]
MITMPSVDITRYVTHLSLLLDAYFTKLYKENDLSATDVRILLTIRDEEGINQEYFSKETLLSKNIVSQKIKRLVKMGYINLLEDPSDKRNNILSLTDSGKEIADYFHKEHVKVNEQLATDISDFNIRSLNIDFLKIIKNAKKLK